MTDDPPIEDESPQTLRQRLMPQASIRSLIALSTICAMIMWLVRTMLVGDSFWAKCVGAVLLTTVGCFALYAALFLLAHLFTVVTSPLVDAIENTSSGNRDASAKHETVGEG